MLRLPDNIDWTKCPRLVKLVNMIDENRLDSWNTHMAHAILELAFATLPKITPTPIVVYPIPMLLHCPICAFKHVDEGEFAEKPHTTHACQHCGHVWRPAIQPTVGVQFLPGFKNESTT
jgi:hypothetical protein